MLRDVTDPAHHDVRDRTQCVHGDGERLDLSGRPGSDLADDGRQKDAETVEHRVRAVLAQREGVDLPVLHAFLDVFLVEFLRRLGLSDLGLAKEDHIAAVFLGEELRGLRAVGQDERHDESRHDRGDAVDQDDPTPGAPACISIHEADSVSDEPSGGTGDGGGGEEIGRSQRDVLLVVKHGEVDDHSREHAGLKQTEQQTARNQAR